MANVLTKAVDHCDNFRPETDPTLWKFYVFDVPYPVGLIRDCYVSVATWDSADFVLDQTKRTVRLNPATGKNVNHTEACQDALVKWCKQNVAHFRAAFEPWLARAPSKRDFHGIFGLEGPLKLLGCPTPARGIFGLATAGIHVNFYQTRKVNGKEVIDSLWFSKRSETATYPNALDQVCAGAIDAEDDMDYMLTLRRELQEEVGMVLGADNKTVLYNGKKCGELRGGVQTLSIATLKGPVAGPREQGHLEFAVRFAFDLCLAPGFNPNPHDSDIAKFFPIKNGPNLAKETFKTEWKYSSEAVFLDFVLRHGLMTTGNDAGDAALRARLHYAIPLRNAQKYIQ
jgi:8-oxo-dGTP pyrophosphatase MutT (NUDIX family)